MGLLISDQLRATVKQAINRKQVFDKMLGLAVNTRSKSWETIALIIHASKLLWMEGEHSADVGRSRQQCEVGCHLPWMSCTHGKRCSSLHGDTGMYNVLVVSGVLHVRG